MNAIIDEEDIDDEDIKEMVRELRSLPIHPQPRKRELPEIKEGAEPATKEPPKLELKQLPTHLRYAYLDKLKHYPVIINVSLEKDEEEKLLIVLRKYKDAIGWTISDIKEISTTLCTHKRHMEENFKPVVKYSRTIITPIISVS